MAWRLRGALVAGAAALVLGAGTPALAAWVTTGSGTAAAKAGFWALVHWNNAACPHVGTCSVAIGNNGTFTATVEVVDASGNIATNIGPGKTVTVSIAANGSTGQFTAPGTAGTADRSLALPATGQAISPQFSYKTGSGNNWTDRLTATVTGFGTATLTLTK